MELTELKNQTFWLNEENNNKSDSSSDEQHLLLNGTSDGNYPVTQDILYWLNFYYLGGIVIVGVLGNGKNVVSFIISKNERRSPSYYLASLALADTIFLAIIFIVWLNHFDIELFSANGIYQMFFYISSASSCMSAWLVVAFTFERLIVVRYPLKRYKLCTVRRAKIIIAWLTIVIAIVQAVSLSAAGVKEKSTASIKTSKCNNHSYFNFTEGYSQMTNSHWTNMLPSYYQVMRVFNIIEVFATLAVPPILIVVMNGLIIHGLFQFNRIFKTGTNKHRSSLRTTQSNCKQVAIQMKAMGRLRPIQGRPLQKHLSSGSRLKDEAVDRVQSQNMTSHSSSNCISHAINNYTTMAIVEEQLNQASPSVPSSPHNVSRDFINQTQSLIDPELGSSANADSELIYIDVTEGNKYSELVTRDIDNELPNESCTEPSAEEGSHQQQKRFIDTGVICQTQHLDMDAIQTDISHHPLSSDDNDELRTTSVDIDHRQQVLVEDQQQIAVENRNEVELNHHTTTSPTCSEYRITKKLVIISTVHILLNMPSCVMNLKIFIDETLTSNNNDEDSQLTWILQEFSMVLYYTNFAINFLLYSTSSVSYSYQFTNCCKRRRRFLPLSNRIARLLRNYCFRNNV